MPKLPANFVFDEEQLSQSRPQPKSKHPKTSQATTHVVKIRKRRTSIEDLLTDPPRLKAFLDYLRVGGSLSSAAAAARLNPDIASKWIRRGSTAKKGPYRQLFREVQSALGEATVVAEASVRTQNPLVWLERGPGKFVAPQWSEAKMDEELELARLNAEAAQANSTLTVTQDVYYESMKELRKAGVDLNAVFDNDDPISILSSPIPPPTPGLPAPNTTTHSPPEKTPEEDPGESLGDFNYDDDEEDMDGASTDGTNYAEDGNWQSANYSLPSALGGSTDPTKPEHYLHNPPIPAQTGGPLPPGRNNQAAEIAKASRKRPAFPATPDLATSLASDGRVLTPGSPSVSGTLQSLREALQRPVTQTPKPSQVVEPSKPPEPAVALRTKSLSAPGGKAKKWEKKTESKPPDKSATKGGKSTKPVKGKKK